MSNSEGEEVHRPEAMDDSSTVIASVNDTEEHKVDKADDDTPNVDQVEEPKKRALEEDVDSKDADTIATHYNKIRSIGKDSRHSSNIIGLRNFNNWVKSVLIKHFCGQTHAKEVLDLACGKGGDLPKWKRTMVKELVGVDIAEVSVEEAKKRYEETRPRFSASYHVLDAFHKDWSSIIPVDRTFELISCQFAFHYCFESEESARHSLKMISQHLRVGGIFFGTIPNFSAIRRKFGAKEERKISNSIYSLRLDEGAELIPSYGQRYFFALDEAIDDCPEYFIPFPMLECLAEEFGLESCMEEPFQSFFLRFSEDPAHRDLLTRMNIIDRNDQLCLTPDEMEAAELYMAFAFRKTKQ